MKPPQTQSAFPGIWGLNVGILPKEGRVVSEMESNDDNSLDRVDWKEEKVTEQDRKDAEEELPPELRYNGEGENNCSENRIAFGYQAMIPALTRVSESNCSENKIVFGDQAQIPALTCVDEIDCSENRSVFGDQAMIPALTRVDEIDCSENRVVLGDQAMRPALTRVDEMEVIPDL